MSAKNGKYINCIVCNKEFYIKRRRFDQAKFCSLICAGHARKGIIPIRAFKRNDPRITGQGNYQWKEKTASYVAIHQWIKRWGNNINKCSECDSLQTIQWANISGKYKRELSDWKRLCVKCHFKFDDHAEKVRKTWENKRKYA